MKLYKSLFGAAALSVLGMTAGNAMTLAQCEEVGGTVNLAAAECILNAAQEQAARSLGYLPPAADTAAATGMGTVTVGGGAAAAAGGLLLTVVLAGDGTTGTTTTTN